MKKVSVLLLVFFISACAGNSVKTENLSPDQKEIMVFLNELQQTWNTKNQDGYLALWHPNSKIMYSRDRVVVSKAEFAQILPERMKLSPVMELKVSDIKVTGNSAIVKASGRPDGRTLIHLDMNLERENGKWYLMSWKY